MRSMIAGALMVALSVAANGAGYDDFTKASQLERAGDVDGALAAYTSALKSGDLAAGYQPKAYLGRANALIAKYQCGEALTNIEEAIKRRPSYYDAVYSRMRAHICLDNSGAALADADQLIALAPGSPYSYSARGDLQWDNGNFAQAALDFQKAADHKPYIPYNLIWYAISSLRVAQFDSSWFETTADKSQFDTWPRPLLDYLRGRIKAEKVYSEAARGDGSKPAEQKCEADFYFGEMKLIAKQDGAAALLDAASKNCPEKFIEHRAAQIELKRMP